MGITGLLPFLKKASRSSNISEFRGCTAAVDSYCLLHRGAFGCAEKLATGVKTDQYVLYCLKYVNMLIAKGIRPIMVFDGCHLPSKKGVEVARRKNRDLHRQKAAKLLAEGKHSEARDSFTKCIDISPEMALELIVACRAKNVDCIVAPYEADSQLAFLTREGFADLVITEDSDLLLFQCPAVMFKLDLNGFGILIEQHMISSALPLRSDLYSFEKFRYMCMLSGCDYLPSMPGIGLVKACKVFQKTRQSDILQIIRKMPILLKMSSLRIDEEYVAAFHRADNTFLYQLVYDPKLRRLRPLTEYPVDAWLSSKEGEELQFDPASMDYAGSYMDDQKAFDIAIGNMNIFTGELISNFNADKYIKECKQKDIQTIWDKDFTKKSFKKRNSQAINRPETANKVKIINSSPLQNKVSTNKRKLVVQDREPSVPVLDFISMYSSGNRNHIDIDDIGTQKAKKDCGDGRRTGIHDSPLNPFSSSSTSARGRSGSTSSILDRIADSQQYSVVVEQQKEQEVVEEEEVGIISPQDYPSTPASASGRDERRRESRDLKRRAVGRSLSDEGQEEDEGMLTDQPTKKRHSNQMMSNVFEKDPAGRTSPNIGPISGPSSGRQSGEPVVRRNRFSLSSPRDRSADIKLNVVSRFFTNQNAKKDNKHSALFDLLEPDRGTVVDCTDAPRIPGREYSGPHQVKQEEKDDDESFDVDVKGKHPTPNRDSKLNMFPGKRDRTTTTTSITKDTEGTDRQIPTPSNLDTPSSCLTSTSISPTELSTHTNTTTPTLSSTLTTLTMPSSPTMPTAPTPSSPVPLATSTQRPRDSHVADTPSNNANYQYDDDDDDDCCGGGDGDGDGGSIPSPTFSSRRRPQSDGRTSKTAKPKPFNLFSSQVDIKPLSPIKYNHVNHSPVSNKSKLNIFGFNRSEQDSILIEENKLINNDLENTHSDHNITCISSDDEEPIDIKPKIKKPNLFLGLRKTNKIKKKPKPTKTLKENSSLQKKLTMFMFQKP